MSGISIIVTIKDRCIIQNDISYAKVGLCINQDNAIEAHKKINYDRFKLNREMLLEPIHMFEQFLKSLNYHSNDFVDKGYNIELVVVDWYSTDADVEDLITQYWDHPFKLKFVGKDEEFSRGYGLNIGAEMASHKILHFTDVDMEYMSDRILCETNALVDGKAIFPVIAKQITPSAIMLYMEIVGFGISSVTKNDFISAGKFPDHRYWGGEDTTLYSNVSITIGSENIKRELRPDLIHTWHPESPQKLKLKQ